jgi:hypothetical protein
MRILELHIQCVRVIGHPVNGVFQSISNDADHFFVSLGLIKLCA